MARQGLIGLPGGDIPYPHGRIIGSGDHLLAVR